MTTATVPLPQITIVQYRFCQQCNNAFHSHKPQHSSSSSSDLHKQLNILAGNSWRQKFGGKLVRASLGRHRARSENTTCFLLSIVIMNADMGKKTKHKTLMTNTELLLGVLIVRESCLLDKNPATLNRYVPPGAPRSSSNKLHHRRTTKRGAAATPSTRRCETILIIPKNQHLQQHRRIILARRGLHPPSQSSHIIVIA